MRTLPKHKAGYGSCYCGIVLPSRHIRAHRMQCEEWQRETKMCQQWPNCPCTTRDTEHNCSGGALVNKGFVALMEGELRLNQYKGDWREWKPVKEDAMRELMHHVAKLADAMERSDADKITEHAADVANIAMKIEECHGGHLNSKRTLALMITEKEKAVLLKLANMHYDYLCKKAGEPGGLINNLSAAAINGLTNEDIQTLMKCCEIRSHLEPEEAALASSFYFKANQALTKP